MSKRLAIAAVGAAALLAAPTALAMPVDGITGPAFIANAVCPSGKVIVYATQNVRNSTDQGVLGNVWAIANYQRILTVIQETPNTFCATTMYRNGSYTTFAGPSPGGTGVVSQGVQGPISSAYRTTTFFGVLQPYPLEPVSGSFTTDYQCDSQGNCPGLVDWTTFYFASTVGFTANYWSYGYINSSHGNWLQNPARGYGDITG